MSIKFDVLLRANFVLGYAGITVRICERSRVELPYVWATGLLHTGCTNYTGCPRRNVPHFGRVFLMLKYTDITQNTYIQS